MLRSYKKKMITSEESEVLAAECGIELMELPAVLWLLQHFIVSIRHYSENPDLWEYIVNSPQVLIDAPTHQLLAETFSKCDLYHVDKKDVWTRGVFTMTTLRKLGMMRKLCLIFSYPSYYASTLLHHYTRRRRPTSCLALLSVLLRMALHNESLERFCFALFRRWPHSKGSVQFSACIPVE